MKNQLLLLATLMSSISASAGADDVGLRYQTPKNIQFTMALHDAPTDCTKINEMVQKISKLDCSSPRDALMCGSLKNSLQFESKWGTDTQGIGGRFSKNYSLNLSTSFAQNSSYSKRFDVLYPSSAEVSMPDQLQLTAKGKVSSVLVSLMEDLKLDVSVNITNGGIPSVVTKNKLLACGLENGDLLLESRSKLYISYSHPLDSVKEKVLTKVYQRALEVNDSSRKNHKKEFDLGVEVGKTLSAFKELNLSISELDEVATSIHSLMLENNENSFILRTQERDVSKVIHEMVSPGYQMQESIIQFSVK
jgi:hypothetical protein